MTDPNDLRSPWLRRVQALIAQAESTEFPDEAETFLAKAQELMARHAIDESMLQSEREPSSVVSEALVVEPPYASPRATLLSQVASANGCRAVLVSSGRGVQHCTLVGRPNDIERTKVLFAALSVHATRAMVAAPVPPGDTPRRFRHAFVLAFAARIGQRLREAAAVAEREAERSSGRSVSLVLARRDDEVEAAMRAEFPRLGTRRATASSSAGLRHGTTAADRADLGRAGLAGRRPGLNAG